MVALLCFLLTLLALPFKSKTRLEAENAVLRRQLIILRRKVRGRVRFTNRDRLFLVQLYRWFPSVLKAIMIVQPETLVRWHRGPADPLRTRRERPYGSDAAEQRDEVAPLHCPDASHAFDRRWHTSAPQETGALRDFSPAYVGSGSKPQGLGASKRFPLCPV